MEENIVVFDSEFTSLNRPFCYNLGYVIVNPITREVLKRADYVIEQVWHNLELFQSAYYAEKRPLYISAMKGRKAVMDKWGYVCQQMKRDFEAFNVTSAYAYNSPCDEQTMVYNCEWFKTMNPFDNIPIHDIRGYVHQAVAQTEAYKKFCDDNELYTETRNYSTTAETAYKFITNNTEFVEAHTALADSEIEKDILFYCIDQGLELDKDYKVLLTIARPIKKKLTITANGITTVFEYIKKKEKKNGDNLVINLN